MMSRLFYMLSKLFPEGRNSPMPSSRSGFGALGVVVNQIITAGTAAHATIVNIMSHTAVIFSAIAYGFKRRYINFQTGLLV